MGASAWRRWNSETVRWSECPEAQHPDGERGKTLGAVKMLGVASWRKLRARLGTGRGGLRLLAVRQPNRRVQRTRSSASAHRSPLTRYPLGGRGR